MFSIIIAWLAITYWIIKKTSIPQRMCVYECQEWERECQVYKKLFNFIFVLILFIFWLFYLHLFYSLNISITLKFSFSLLLLIATAKISSTGISRWAQTTKYISCIFSLAWEKAGLIILGNFCLNILLLLLIHLKLSHLLIRSRTYYWIKTTMLKFAILASGISSTETTSWTPFVEVLLTLPQNFSEVCFLQANLLTSWRTQCVQH